MTHSAPVSAPMKGLLISTPLGSDKHLRRDTVQCVHCGRAWVWTPKSGRERGYCVRCGGFVCGRGCEECVPYEALIENLEAGLPFFLARKHRRIFVAVSG